MPSWYPSWTNCLTNVANWISNNQAMANTIAMAGVSGFVGLGAFAAFMQFLGWGILHSLIPGGGLFFMGACMAGVYYCNWWLNVRLICLGGDYSALGAIYNIEPPTPSYGFWNLGDYDTDYSFNLLLYAAAPGESLPTSFVIKFSPPQPWQASVVASLKAQWSTLYPEIAWDDANLILPQVTQMGSLGLGFTGQYAGFTGPTGNPSQLPLMSISVTPATASVGNNGSSVQFIATGYRADGTSQNLTDGPDAATWTSSATNIATVDGSGLATATNNSLVTGSTTITATDQATQVAGIAQLTVQDSLPISNHPPTEEFLLHCEIEGPGMIEFRNLLLALASMFGAVAAISAIPVIGWAVSLILALFAFLALLFDGPAIQSDTAGPPNPPGSPSGGDGWGGYAYVDTPFADSMVDIVYVYGRWVFDSLHQPAGSNELHPVHFVIKVDQVSQSDLANGNWPADLDGKKAALDKQYTLILAPPTLKLLDAADLQWSLHPLIDGCQGATSYAPPSTPPAPK